MMGNKGLSAIGLQFVLFIISIFILGYSYSILNGAFNQAIYNLNRSTIETFHNNLNLIVNTFEICRASFRPDGFNEGAAVKILKYGSVTDVLVQDGTELSSSLIVKSIRLKNIVADDSTKLPIYKASMEIVYGSKALTGLSSILKKPKIIPIYYTLGDTNIGSCFGENSAAYLCAKLGGNYDPDVIPKCLPPTLLSKKCASSQVLKSITMKGDLECL